MLVQLSDIDQFILTVAYEMALGASSQWAPYIDLLPLRKDRQPNLPMMWDDEILNAYIGTAFQQRVLAERNGMCGLIFCREYFVKNR